MMSIVSMQRGILALAVLAWPTSTGFATDPANLEQAAERIGQALNAEIDGDFLSRAQFLKEAEQLQADFAPAHWYRGEVIGDDGQWLSVDEAIAAAKSNKLLDEYEAMRGQLPNTVPGHWEAVRWCVDRRLPAQCRGHLEAILYLEHDNAAARSALGHQQVGSEWLTPNDLTRLRQRAEFARNGHAKYAEQLTKLLEKCQHSNRSIQQQAQNDLTEITDPLAIPVMEFASQQGDLSTALFVTKWLGGIEHPEASLALARIAVSAEARELRQTAVSELKNKPLHDFVPEMLNALSSPIAFTTTPVINSRGVLEGFRQSFAKEGMGAYQLLNVDVNLQYLRDFTPTVRQQTDNSLEEGAPSVINGSVDLAQVWRNIRAQIAMTSQAVADTKRRENAALVANELSRQNNTLIASTLGEIAGREFSGSPNELWQWWDSYNETEYQKTKFARRQYQATTFSTALYNPYQFEARNSPLRNSPFPAARFTGECFVAGTMVTTLRGSQAIETLSPGDLVLTRHIASGALSYQPVIATTLRPPAMTVRLTVNDEVVEATTGHLLWVSGKGWTKAGEIEAGDLLHSVNEPAVVMSKEEGSILPTHNLVVADAHTYFVGSSRVLSHDVLPRGSVHERVPGEFLFTSARP